MRTRRGVLVAVVAAIALGTLAPLPPSGDRLVATAQGTTVAAVAEPEVYLDLVLPAGWGGRRHHQTVRVGEDVVVLAVIRNAGRGTATDLTLVQTFPETVNLLHTPSTCSPTQGRGVSVRCPLGDLPGRSERQVRLRLELVWDCTAWGEPGEEALVGTRGPDVLCGGGTTGPIRGRGGADVLHSVGPGDPVSISSQRLVAVLTYEPQDGADRGWCQLIDHGSLGSGIPLPPTDLRGGAGPDVLLGGPSRFSGDRLEGGSGHDYLDGDAGRDVLLGGLGRDMLRGGDDGDLLRGGKARGSRTEAPRDHWNRLLGGRGRDECAFGPQRGPGRTDFRGARCELPTAGAGWLHGEQPRLDRGPGGVDST